MSSSNFRSQSRYGSKQPPVTYQAPAQPAAATPAIVRETDAANAERLIASHHGILRYHSSSKQWLVWADTHWRYDTTGEVRRLAIAEARKLPALGAGDKFAKDSESLKGLNATMTLAADMLSPRGRPTRVGEEELNRPPHLLPTAGGTVDLRTGALGPADPEHLFTQVSPVMYDARAKAPTWVKFVDQITCGRRDLSEFLQRWAGYCATGETREMAIVFAIGEGGNGKGVYMNTLQRALGSFSITTPITTLMEQRGDGPRADVARFSGRRLVMASEGAQGQRLDEAGVKSLVSSDKVTARFLFGNFFEFAPTHKITVGTNHRPIIVGTDKGIWRRILLVPFDATFTETGEEPGTSKMDPLLEAKLEAELPGILAWIVEGAKMWYRDGLKRPTSVRDETEAYRQEMDRVGQFLDDCTERAGENDRVPAAELFDAYVLWCKRNAIDPLNANAFSRELTKKGIGQRNSGGRWRTGIRFRLERLG